MLDGWMRQGLDSLGGETGAHKLGPPLILEAGCQDRDGGRERTCLREDRINHGVFGGGNVSQKS